MCSGCCVELRAGADVEAADICAAACARAALQLNGVDAALRVLNLLWRSVAMVLPVLAQVPAESDADCKCATLEDNDIGGNFIAERSCRCSADSDAAAAVGHAGLHELLRQLDLLLGGDAADDALRRCLVQVACGCHLLVLRWRGGENTRCGATADVDVTMIVSISCAAAMRAHVSLEPRGVGNVPMLCYG